MEIDPKTFQQMLKHMEVLTEALMKLPEEWRLSMLLGVVVGAFVKQADGDYEKAEQLLIEAVRRAYEHQADWESDPHKGSMKKIAMAKIDKIVKGDGP